MNHEDHGSYSSGNQLLGMPKLSHEEWSMLPEALWQLARAKWDVLRRPAVEWMPKGGQHAARSTQHAAGSEEQQARSTQHATGSEEQEARSTQHAAGSGEQEARSTQHATGREEQEARSTQHAAGSGEQQATGSEGVKCLAVVRVIEGLGRRVPWPSVCLDQALAAHRMLKKRGLKHTLHLGVRKLTDGTLEAHAWITDEDKIILGRSDRKFQEVASFHFIG